MRMEDRLMSNRFEVRYGKWGAYFHDTYNNEDLPLEIVVDLLNQLYPVPKSETPRRSEGS